MKLTVEQLEALRNNSRTSFERGVWEYALNEASVKQLSRSAINSSDERYLKYFDAAHKSLKKAVAEKKKGNMNEYHRHMVVHHQALSTHDGNTGTSKEHEWAVQHHIDELGDHADDDFIYGNTHHWNHYPKRQSHNV